MIVSWVCDHQTLNTTSVLQCHLVVLQNLTALRCNTVICLLSVYRSCSRNFLCNKTDFLVILQRWWDVIFANGGRRGLLNVSVSFIFLDGFTCWNQKSESDRDFFVWVNAEFSGWRRQKHAQMLKQINCNNRRVGVVLILFEINKTNWLKNQFY